MFVLYFSTKIILSLYLLCRNCLLVYKGVEYGGAKVAKGATMQPPTRVFSSQHHTASDVRDYLVQSFCSVSVSQTNGSLSNSIFCFVVRE
jgi:hypothetical protein